MSAVARVAVPSRDDRIALRKVLGWLLYLRLQVADPHNHPGDVSRLVAQGWDRIKEAGLPDSEQQRLEVALEGLGCNLFELPAVSDLVTVTEAKKLRSRASRRWTRFDALEELLERVDQVAPMLSLSPHSGRVLRAQARQFISSVPLEA